MLSTLHTNSAPESVVRLLDLGMDPFNFADALQAILAQRLVKALCPKCKQAYEASDTEIDALADEFIYDTPLAKPEILALWQTQFSADKKFTLYRPVGCSECNKTGYRGRVGIHELMTVTPSIKHLIQTHALVSELLEAAIFAGMRTLKQDGISKILQGQTDLAQVRAVAI